MTTYSAPLRDIQFVLHELLDVHAELAHVDGFERETTEQILDAAGAFASEVIAPLNSIGDKQGCRVVEPGVVQTPDGFKEAYRQFVAAGWTGVACDPADGGQGMPSVLNSALFEIFCGANMAWSAYAGMSHAAYTCLSANANAEQRALFMPRIASGEWAGTMCLTEPHAGTDLGLLRTRATPRADGSYAVTGTKIFISGGEQDLTSNIVHLVLARLPDAPPGVKGISLFIVPKFLTASDGEPTARNSVSCGSVESKMGIHGNSTCTMNFDGATGWLLGEVNKGLAGMFVMMNHARLIVGINAIGLMDAAYQKALSYARDRLQGRVASTGTQPRQSAADPIVAHADVKRMLLTQKAYVEGTRAFALWAAHLADVQHGHPDEKARRRATDLLALATPIVKAFSSDLAVECSSMAMQVFGGHGYIQDNGVEQHLRDARIIPLYEGANGIQAMDLLGRKVLNDGGRNLDTFLDEIAAFAQSQRGRDELDDLLLKLEDAVSTARGAARLLFARSAAGPDGAGADATLFMRLMGHVCIAWMWARSARVALDARDHSDEPIYAAKLATASFYFQRLLPEIRGLAAALEADPAVVCAVNTDWL
ncbi:MAG: acyl-CoA dehydrogenase [Comamonadaceae bacterium]|nr:MAG: acyl-CoA dehydrogenase [Comamonadaceae bacterium]